MPDHEYITTLKALNDSIILKSVYVLTYQLSQFLYQKVNKKTDTLPEYSCNCLFVQ